MLIGKIVLTALAAYFLGCLNGAILVSKFILRDDVRRYGSGNAGITNFYRSKGGNTTIFVLIIDVLKMVIGSLIGWSLLGGAGYPLEGKLFAGLCVMLGHVFPVFFGFKGGKGVLSGGTLTLMVHPIAFVICFGSFLIAVILTRYVSLGSVIAGFLFPFVVYFMYGDPLCIALATISGGLLIVRHIGNIQRLLNGTEAKFKKNRKKNKNRRWRI